jgi:peptide/nickel transport system permease protein
MTDVLHIETCAGELAPPATRFALVRRLLAHRSFLIGFVLIAALAVVVVFAPLFIPAGRSAMHIRFRFKPPSHDDWFGTDMFGRDIFVRVLYGGRISLAVGFMVSSIAGACGCVLGISAAHFRWLDAPIMRLMDALMSFPAVLLALGIAAALGPGVSSVIIALTVAYIPAGVRIVRASALVVREMDYVQAARIAGAGNIRIMTRHILANSLGPLLVHLSFLFAYAILAEATLSFLGVGVQPPTPSWGNIIAEGRDYATQAWWLMFFPGLAISVATLGMNLLGDGLRDVLDPRLARGG